MFYICNAFSLSMLERNEGASFAPVFSALTEEQAVFIAQRAQNTKTLDGNYLVSAVGHADTAVLFNKMLGISLEVNRISVKLERGDFLLVGQYDGPRLPEGTSVLPEGAKIDWWLITV